jgi:hypothetical protein
MIRAEELGRVGERPGERLSDPEPAVRVFRRKGTKEKPRGGVAIGDQVFDLCRARDRDRADAERIAAAGASAWRELRKQISKRLSSVGSGRVIPSTWCR